MDWSPVLTVVATGGATLAGVWLNGRITLRSEARRSDAEQRKLDSEDARERERHRREDEAATRQAESEQRASAAALAHEIADQFLKGLRDIREFMEVDDAGFESYYEEKWQTRLDLALRKNVGRVLDDADRNRLIEILDALEDASALADWDFEKTRQKVEQLLLLGFDLAATSARRQKLDTELEARVLALRKLVESLDSHRAMQQELQREQRLIEAQAQVPKPPKPSG